MYVKMSALIFALCLSSATSTNITFEAGKKYCGPELAKMMEHYCAEFNTQFSSAGNTKSPGKDNRGIVEQCCRNSCTASTFVSFCRVPKNNTEIGNDIVSPEMSLELSPQLSPEPTESGSSTSPLPQTFVKRPENTDTRDPEFVYVEVFNGPLASTSPDYTTMDDRLLIEL